jgi:polysaccharide export outer membrane protein
MKFRLIGAALAAVVVVVSGLVYPADAASPWGLWNDPQGSLVAPEPGPAPAPAVKKQVTPRIRESKPEKKWEFWNEPPPGTVPMPPPAAAKAPEPPPNEAPPAVPAVAEIKAPPPPAAPPATASAKGDTLAVKASEAPLPTVAEIVPGDGYIIGPGDQLDISVWKDETLTRSLVVLPDGNISFPLIGDVRAAGKTVAALRADMEQRLHKYVTDLVLSIDVKQMNSMHIYVIGRVNGPGRQVLNSNVTVLQALALAGGLNPFAKKDRIKVMRTEGGETKSYLFRYSEVIDGENLGQNILLKRGDVVVVP